MSDAILILNAGSSTIKFGLFDIASDGPQLLCKGLLDEHDAEPRLTIKDGKGEVLFDKQQPDRADEAGLLDDILTWVDGYLACDDLVAIGHRIVHGGQDFVAPVLIDGDVLHALQALTPLAPLHQLRSLQPIKPLLSLRPELPQIACFDTAFHHDLGPRARRFAIPRRFDELGIRRYGFHGLSYQFIAHRLAELSPALAAGRTVVAHLGSGSSLCAMQGGISIDTTMGLTALDGLMMGTRCGAIDPGVLLYLQQVHGMSASELERMLYSESGLLGVSGLSADMRVLAGSAEPHAIEAVELYVERAAKEIAAMAVSLGGLDCLVFTAGIGEHSPEIRRGICARLGFLGVKLDAAANDANAADIAAPGSKIELHIIPTSEETTIARDCVGLLANR
ncbi:acetate/propionate family kinase [Tardiphaga sp.]|uniref:acetate/propionate family kinase n=1 Tax=Tardiphaga sp. TaxID=1926292 RepID=UPI002636D7CD|nr:acetate/propionate family kinase [Tardiphaga sp.]MDB5618085.1 acetate kinase [Tardiphaga sp.]